MKWLFRHQSNAPQRDRGRENYLLVAKKGGFAASDTVFSSDVAHPRVFPL